MAIVAAAVLAAIKSMADGMKNAGDRAKPLNGNATPDKTDERDDTASGSTLQKTNETTPLGNNTEAAPTATKAEAAKKVVEAAPAAEKAAEIAPAAAEAAPAAASAMSDCHAKRAVKL